MEDFRVPSAPPLRSGSSECKTSDRISDTIKTWNTDKVKYISHNNVNTCHIIMRIFFSQNCGWEHVMPANFIHNTGNLEI